MKLADICIRQGQYRKALLIIDALFAKVIVKEMKADTNAICGWCVALTFSLRCMYRYLA